MSFTVVLRYILQPLKNEINSAHNKVLIKTRYCRGHTPPGNLIDLLHKFHTNSYLHISALYRSLNFIVCLKRYHFYTSWPQTAELGKIRHTDNKSRLSIYSNTIMGRRPKNWCQIGIVKAIQAAVPGFIHSCTRTAHLAVYVRGSRLDEYCIEVNGRKTNLLPTGQYLICSRMKNQVSMTY